MIRLYFISVSYLSVVEEFWRNLVRKVNVVMGIISSRPARVVRHSITIVGIILFWYAQHLRTMEEVILNAN